MNIAKPSVFGAVSQENQYANFGVTSNTRLGDTAKAVAKAKEEASSSQMMKYRFTSKAKVRAIAPIPQAKATAERATLRTDLAKP